jgi:hypothetical protein
MSGSRNEFGIFEVGHRLTIQKKLTMAEKHASTGAQELEHGDGECVRVQVTKCLGD